MTGSPPHQQPQCCFVDSLPVLVKAAPRPCGDIVPSVFTRVPPKHSKPFLLVDCISVSVDRMQRNLEPVRTQRETWQKAN